MAKVKVNCAACGQGIEKFPKDAKRTKFHFCNKDCQQKPCIPVPCHECRNEFLATGYNLRDAKFCSSECRNARDRREQRHKKSPTVTLVCERCSEPFDVRRSVAKAQRYCSQQCSGAAIGQRHTGENSPVWKPKVDVICDYCGAHFETFPSRVGRRKYCGKEHKRLADLERIASGPRTDIEVAMAAALLRSGIAFDEQVVMLNSLMVDFKLRDHAIIVQCDGIFWHDRMETARRDRQQDQRLADEGYTVLRFTNQEVLEHIDDCLRRIKETTQSGQMPLINW